MCVCVCVCVYVCVCIRCSIHVHTCLYSYPVSVIRVSGLISEALANLKATNPEIRAIFMGTRRTDPHASKGGWHTNDCTSIVLINIFFTVKYVCCLK